MTTYRNPFLVPQDRPPATWWRNGLGWCLFVVGPGCGLVVGLAIGEVVWG